MHNNHRVPRHALIAAGSLLLVFAAAAPVEAQSSETFILRRSGTSGGGGTGSSPTMSASSGVGQASPQGAASSESVTITPGFFKPNKPPLAAAGADVALECSSPTNTPVTLDGSASADPDQDTLHFSWSGVFGQTTGATPTVSLPLGPSTVTLLVNDDQATSAPDSVLVSVNVRPEGFASPLAALVLEGQPPPVPARAFRQGATVPMKVRLFCGAAVVTDLSGVPGPQIVGLRRTGAPLNLTTTDLDAGQANDAGLAFRFSDGDSWVYNLSTKVLSAGSYVITIRMPDGRLFESAFVLK